LKIAFRSNRKSGFDDVNAQVFELARQTYFFLQIHRTPRRLFAVVQSRIKNSDFVGFHFFPKSLNFFSAR